MLNSIYSSITSKYLLLSHLHHLPNSLWFNFILRNCKITDMLAVAVPDSCDVIVEIENQAIPKPFMGGYINVCTGTNRLQDYSILCFFPRWGTLGRGAIVSASGLVFIHDADLSTILNRFLWVFLCQFESNYKLTLGMWNLVQVWVKSDHSIIVDQLACRLVSVTQTEKKTNRNIDQWAFLFFNWAYFEIEIVLRSFVILFLSVHFSISLSLNIITYMPVCDYAVTPGHSSFWSGCDI